MLLLLPLSAGFAILRDPFPGGPKVRGYTDQPRYSRIQRFMEKPQ